MPIAVGVRPPVLDTRPARDQTREETAPLTHPARRMPRAKDIARAVPRPAGPAPTIRAGRDGAAPGRAAASGAQFEGSPHESPVAARREPRRLEPVNARMARLPGRLTGAGGQ